jgi:hypothetical protein
MAKEIFEAIKTRVDAGGFRLIKDGRVVARRFYGHR